MKTIIAIDGPAASGKGTIARQVAAHFGVPYLDTGKLYRAVAFYMHGQGLSPEVAEDLAELVRFSRRIDPQVLDNQELLSEEIGKLASIVSARPEIRTALHGFQRDFAHSGKGAVLDGRDIGTVICPEAEFKFFITADAKTRAARRFKELQSLGKPVIEAEILKDLEERDARDAKRDVAPLIPARDAVLIDTTAMDIAAAVQAVLAKITTA